MSELPKKIETEEEFNKIRIEYHCDYTIDDFIEMFRVSERTMKDLLKGIEHISISKSLYLTMKERYGNSINRQQFYNREHTIFELVKDRKIVFKLNYIHYTLLDGVFYKSKNELESIEIFPSVVFKYRDCFYSLLETAGSTTDVNNIFKGNKRQSNRKVKRIEGMEINIGKNIKRYMPLDAITIYVLMHEMEGIIKRLNS